MDKLLMGIDIGTSLIKSSLFDVYGTQISVTFEKVNLITPKEGYYELDQIKVWEAVISCIKKCIENSSENPNKIIGIACSGQGDGLWILDKEKKPVRNAILWCDNRAKNFIKEWMNIGFTSKIAGDKRFALWPGTSLGILAWIKQNENSNYKNIKTVFCCKDWVNFKLTGKILTDYTDGSIPFLDISSKEYSTDFLNEIGMASIVEKLPKPVPSSSIIGTITHEASLQTGLPYNIPVCGGALDVVANTIGAGGTKIGDTILIIGTTLAVIKVFDKMAPRTIIDMNYICGASDEQVITTLGAMSGTSGFNWVVDNLYQGSDRSDMKKLYMTIEADAAMSVPGSNGVLFLPFLKGERSPFQNANATSSFTGITDQTKKADLVNAVLEGIAFSARHNLEKFKGIEGREIIAIGGGASSSYWCQIFADITGLTIKVPGKKEFGTAGAAILIGHALGELPELSFLSNHNDNQDCSYYYPRAETKQLYCELFDLYKDAINLMNDYWLKRNRILTNLMEEK